jgi:hypothetical protein
LENIEMKLNLLRAACVLLTLAFVGDAVAGGLNIVDAAKLDKYWRMQPEVSFMEIGDKRETTYGCIAIGFLIDHQGRLTATHATRLVFDKNVQPRRAQGYGIGIGRAVSVLPPFKPGADNPNRTEVFTIMAIPVFGRGLSARMDDAQRNTAAARLRPSCEIADLAAWIDSHDMRKAPEVEVAPAIDFGASPGGK